MFVKVTNPKKVFWDQSQKIALTGDKVFEVKASLHILSLLNDKHIEEVTKEPESKEEAKKIVEDKKSESAKKDKETMETKKSEKA